MIYFEAGDSSSLAGAALLTGTNSEDADGGGEIGERGLSGCDRGAAAEEEGRFRLVCRMRPCTNQSMILLFLYEEKSKDYNFNLSNILFWRMQHIDGVFKDDVILKSLKNPGLFYFFYLRYFSLCSLSSSFFLFLLLLFRKWPWREEHPVSSSSTPSSTIVQKSQVHLGGSNGDLELKVVIALQFPTKNNIFKKINLKIGVF